MKELLLIMLGGILINNCVFESFLGAAPLLGFAGRKGKTLGMGVSVAVVLVVSCVLCFLAQTLVLDALGAGFMQTLVFVAIILATVYVVGAIAKKLFKAPLGIYFPLIALNGAVLGTAVNSVTEGYGFAAVLLSSVGVGLGFLGGLVVFSALVRRIDVKAVPAPFRGLPISLLAASIVSMALLAFA